MLVVVVAIRLHVLVVVRVVIVGRIVAMVAVVMIVHVRLHIRLIMAQVHRLRILVIRREITVVVCRYPRRIARTIQVVPDRRTLYPYRTNDIARTVDIRITDDLYVQLRCTRLSHERSYVLEDAGCEACLDQVVVAIALYYLHDAQIIHITVAVEVEVVDHIARRVEQLLELTYTTRLCEQRSHSLQVEIIRDIRREGIDLNGGSRGRTATGSRYGADGSYRLGRTYIDRLSRSGRDDTYRETGC